MRGLPISVMLAVAGVAGATHDYVSGNVTLNSGGGETDYCDYKLEDGHLNEWYADISVSAGSLPFGCSSLGGPKELGLRVRYKDDGTTNYWLNVPAYSTNVYYDPNICGIKTKHNEGAQCPIGTGVWADSLTYQVWYNYYQSLTHKYDDAFYNPPFTVNADAGCFANPGIMPPAGPGS